MGKIWKIVFYNQTVKISLSRYPVFYEKKNENREKYILKNTAVFIQILFEKI